MSHKPVRNPGEALAYLVDCTLATVERQSTLKSISKHERERQIQMAQKGVNWMRDFGVDTAGTRAADVLACGGDVEIWLSS